MIKKFNIFTIEEAYLESNLAPLYHHTTTYNFINIINDNKFENPFKLDKIKMVSLSRSKYLDLSYYKFHLDVVIELDRIKLSENYRIIPYDFFIHSKKEDKPKSSLERISPFEYEEIILEDINNIMDFIISINFKEDSILDRQIASIIPILSKKNITLYSNGKIY
jgi:hypothetical protein